MKKSATYSWTRRFGVPAQVFGEFYYGLKKRTPDELIKAAKNPKSPVHHLFEWNNAQAAAEYRLIQARTMINSLHVEVVTPKGKPSTVVAFIKSSDHIHHVATVEATKDELDEAMRECWQDMLAFRAKYKNLEIATLIIMAIDSADKELQKKSGKKSA